MTLADGTALAVDFSGASSADVMLVTTGKAEGSTVKLGKQNVTCYVPATSTPPDVAVKGDAVVVGEQHISLRDGNLVLAAAGE